MDEYRCMASIKSVESREERNIMASNEEQARDMFLTSLLWIYDRKDIINVEIIRISNPHIKKL